MTINNINRIAKNRFWPTVAMCIVLAISFGVYVHSEKKIDRANENRLHAFKLADELRQTSDDLTRMTKNFVVTHDPRYKKYFQDILDIREGKKPRPEGYSYIYWDFVLANEHLPQNSSKQPIALMELMRQAGYSKEEMQKLAESKANSDKLATIEFEAMKLAESVGPNAASNHEIAEAMIHDDNYHKAKAAIMRPLNDLFKMMDKRTFDNIHDAERKSVLFRIVFIVCFFVILLMLWLAYRDLRNTLGEDADVIHSLLHRIGQGDLSSAITVSPGMENSVLADLADMQTKLLCMENERKQTKTKIIESESRLRSIIENEPECIKIVDAKGKLIMMNPAGLAMIEADTFEQVSGKQILDIIAPDFRKAFAELHKRVIAGESMEMEFEVIGLKGGHRWLETHAVPMKDEGETLHLAVTRDITFRKKAEAELRIAATAFEAQTGMVVTDARGIILRVNQAFTEICGYTEEEVLGQNPRMLKSGRHNKDFYQEMWDCIISTGGWQGEIWDKRKSGEEYPKWLTISAVKDTDGNVTNYIGTHYDITERKLSEERINELAFFDQLTGLPNRTLLRDRLNQAITSNSRNGNNGALLFIDLDNFKTLNDTLGHDMGDLLLQLAAQRLKTCVRAEDTTARLGGDEFVVMLVNLSNDEKAAANHTEYVGAKILESLNQIYQLRDIPYHITPSIGAALFSGDMTEIDALLKQADIAMYRAKDSGRNTLRFFDSHMETVVMERAAMEKDLRDAIHEKQFLLHYQAQLAGDRLIGAEVLVRWQHPKRGIVSPADFIPLAEETRLILPLGHWVLETACTQLAKWASLPEMSHLTVAVNVSVHQFHQVDFVDHVMAVLHETGANPKRLKLELTESLVVGNVEDIIEKMFALKAKGVGFSLDDFGTGYSSLSYLKRLPLDQLKIDQSFVRDVLFDSNDAAIAKTVIALAQSLGFGVIAEGVETAEQRDFLAESGCHAYQGYFYSKPLPLENFEEYARKV